MKNTKIAIGQKVQIIRYPGESDLNKVGIVEAINGDFVEVKVKWARVNTQCYMHELKSL